MRTILVQCAASLDVERNMDTIAQLTSSFAAGDVDLLVLPEATMCDFGPRDFDVSDVSETLDGPFASFLAELAQRLECTIVAGMFERTGALPFNTLIVLDSSGELVARYRKIHLFDSFGYQESERFTPGPLEPTIVPIAGKRWGLMTCYDLRFPELARELSSNGAEGFIVPAAWLAGEGKTHQWRTLVHARAIENVCPVIAVGQPGPTYTGHSLVIGPLGETLAEAETEDSVLMVDIDTQAFESARVTNPALEHRRLL